ncbi:MAG: hypothetical protein V3S16_06805 [Candidatus Desulfatibia sp.]|uniref:hypothetical protein n=1 Tax=Candidatus Desulfatibia sp. TaxID=3101189 RepID=UPI002F32B740
MSVNAAMDASSPYEDLYIYYLPPDQQLFGPDYIGCWPWPHSGWVAAKPLLLT